MKKIIFVFTCILIIVSMCVSVVNADNIIGTDEKITDINKIHSLLADYIQNNYPDKVWVTYQKDDNEEEIIGVEIIVFHLPENVPESNQSKIASDIRRYIKEENIDSSLVEIGINLKALDTPENLAGDINSDGKADLTDLTELSLYLIGDKNLTERQLLAADVDGDGEVKLTDLAKFRQYLSKKTESLG